MSEEEEDEEEEEESEEELLALRRDGWVCGSVAGFSAGENKRTQSRSRGAYSATSVIYIELKHL